MTKDKTVSFRGRPDLHKKISDLADLTGQTPSDFIRQIIIKYLNEEADNRRIEKMFDERFDKFTEKLEKLILVEVE